MLSVTMLSGCACLLFFFLSSRRRHTRYWRDWSSDVCSSDLILWIKDQANRFLTFPGKGGRGQQAGAGHGRGRHSGLLDEVPPCLTGTGGMVWVGAHGLTADSRLFARRWRGNIIRVLHLGFGFRGNLLAGRAVLCAPVFPMAMLKRSGQRSARPALIRVYPRPPARDLSESVVSVSRNIFKNGLPYCCNRSSSRFVQSQLLHAHSRHRQEIGRA